jgi:hypothetical protein
MPRGGARPGAGRPKKPLNESLLDGNPGKRDLTVLKFRPPTEPSGAGVLENPTGNQRNQKPAMPSYLELAAKEGGDILPKAGEIYTLLSDFVESAGCTEFVAPILIEDFAFLRRAYLECEFMNRKMGRIAGGKRSPYVNMALDYQKAMMAVYNQIWLIIARNCEEQYEGKNEFLEMLRNRGF